MRIGGKSVAVMSGLAAVLLVAGSAVAAETDNLYSPEACKHPSSSKFKLHLRYERGQNGVWRNIGYRVYNFNDVPDGVVGATSALRFCPQGASNPWPGSNKKVKNNAASGENDHYKYKARVYYHTGYRGAQDVMNPYQHIDSFRNVYKNNASFKWSR
ncbi:hypothetical protein ABZ626_11685 [Streptomyces longispororuber]|uniref:hypothetical protein n=1 Tax=Streptomyces longispororuber TaxID=68230 RepID=UPI0033D5670E